MNTKYLIALVTSSLLASATQVQATTLIYEPRSYAYVQTGDNTTEINNGVMGTTGGTGTSTSHSPDNYLNSASVNANGVNGSATADLHAATVSAWASTAAGGGQYAESRINDTVYFTNSSAGTLTLPFTFSFSGTLTDPHDFATFASGIFNFNHAGGITLAGSGAFASQTLIFGISNNGYIGAQQGGAFFFNGPDNIDLTTYTLNKSYDPLTGLTSGSYAATLIIPVGESSLGIDLRLLLRSCSNSAAGTCDFSPGASLTFGTPFDGLTLSSASASSRFLRLSPAFPSPRPGA